MTKAVGDYGYKLPASVLLSEIIEGANPQVANLDKKRFVLVQEPDNKRRICAPTPKEITGDKTLNARKNYSNDCGVSLLLTLILQCNDLPPIDEVNDEIQRRIRTILFVSKFVSKELLDDLEDKTNLFEANKFYKSDEFRENFKQALIQILLKY
jgi:phage/plasmid-associated DNA primase